MCLQTEVTVHQGGIEAEVLEPGLQSGDIIAVHRGTELVGQRARAKVIGRLFECAVGGFPDKPVNQKAAALLESPHGMVKIGIEVIEGHLPAGR